MIKCPKHPRYQAKRRPRADCQICEYIYEHIQACDRVCHEMDMEYFRRIARGETEYGEDMVEFARMVVEKLGLEEN